jgi:4-hydroxyproline epimerase
VGVVTFDLLDAHRAAVENVASYRLYADVRIEVGGLGTVTGDVAWGGNWFFLVDGTPAPLVTENAPLLTDAALRVREELMRRNIRGDDGAEIDHIEFFGPAMSPRAHSRNFVLCSGGAYDRSPCGTGVSAKLACLAADRKLAPGKAWVQESITGSHFVTSYRRATEGRIIPTIMGSAYLTGESQLFAHPEDPFRYGIPAGGLT